MSYPKLLALILVVIAIGIGVFLWSAKDEGPAQTQTPSGLGTPAEQVSSDDSAVTELVIGFYSWYITQLSKNLQFNSSSDFASGSQQWLAPQFIQRWNVIVEETNANPALLAQDFDPSWADAIHATVINQTGAESTVQVTFAANAHTVYAHLTNGVNGWKIASVTQTP